MFYKPLIKFFKAAAYIMKKLLLILAIVWFGLNAFAKSVQANDYNTAVVAHIIIIIIFFFEHFVDDLKMVIFIEVFLSIE